MLLEIEAFEQILNFLVITRVLSLITLFYVRQSLRDIIDNYIEEIYNYTSKK